MHRCSLLQLKCFKSQRYQAVCKTAIKKAKKKKKFFNNHQNAGSIIKRIKNSCKN